MQSFLNFLLPFFTLLVIPYSLSPNNQGSSLMTMDTMQSAKVYLRHWSSRSSTYHSQLLLLQTEAQRMNKTTLQKGKEILSSSSEEYIMSTCDSLGPQATCHLSQLLVCPQRLGPPTYSLLLESQMLMGEASHTLMKEPMCWT